MLGVALSSAATVSADENYGFYSVRQMIGFAESDNVVESSAVMGYVAGTYDTLQYVINFMAESQENYETDHKTLETFRKCMAFRGSRLGTAVESSKDTWKSVSASHRTRYSAAGALIGYACSDR